MNKSEKWLMNNPSVPFLIMAAGVPTVLVYSLTASAVAVHATLCFLFFLVSVLIYLYPPAEWGGYEPPGA
jgi:hypothetical protein